MTKRIEVAVGILCREDGHFLVQERRAGTDCAGQWEFPGGKQEVDESIEAALVRELNEELGIDITTPAPLTVWEHDYDHAQVRLHTFLIRDWQGEANALEGQQIAWLLPDDIRQLNLLAAAHPLLGLAVSALARA